MPADDARSESFFREKAITEGRVTCASARSEQRAKAERLPSTMHQSIHGHHHTKVQTIFLLRLFFGSFSISADVYWLIPRAGVRTTLNF
jgi:hypothetical protein